MERALYIGRFQPFHKGHLSAIRQINEAPDIDEIIIGIGSSQYHGYLDHPFAAEVREDMIRCSLVQSKPYEIIRIPDIHDYPKWVDHVKNLSPEFGTVYSENGLVKELFENKGYRVRPIAFESSITATRIREMMIQGDHWQNMVPQPVAEILEEIQGKKMLHDLYTRHLRASNTADIIIDYKGEGIVFITRKNEPFKGLLALPGGFLDVGKETIKEAAIREALEETNLRIEPEELHLLDVYSAPRRDPRGATLSTVYYTRINYGDLKAGDDAEKLHIIDPQTVPRLAFDHNLMIRDYLKRIHPINIGQIPYSRPHII